MVTVNRDNIVQSIEELDAELFSLFRSEFQKQRYSLSLFPADSASPLVTYLVGSSLGNLHLDYHDAGRRAALETLAARRAAQLFGAEEAIVRLASVQSASRIVLLHFLKKGDTVLSFHLRKKEYCDGNRLDYRFENFSVSPETHAIDYAALEHEAKRLSPKLLIYSPVSYPRQADYARLAAAAHHAGALLWVDMGHFAGLIATKKMASPIPYADIVTCSAHDALHGPQCALILTNREHAAALHETLLHTGHSSVRWNTFAALAFALKEAQTERFAAYEEQVIKNAQALCQGLTEGGASLLFGGTDSHLVMAGIEGQDGRKLKKTLRETGFLVKPDLIPTLPAPTAALRLSSLTPTMRGMKEDELRAVGRLLAPFLTGERGEADAEATREEVAQLVFDRPLYSEEWLPVQGGHDTATMERMNSLHEFSAQTKKDLLGRLLSKIIK